MSKKRGGRPRLTTQTKALRGTVEPAREQRYTGVDSNDEPTWHALSGFVLRLGPSPGPPSLYPTTDAMRTDWRRRRLEIWEQSRGALPYAAFRFDGLTARGYERLCRCQWWRPAAFDAAALREVLGLLDADECAVDAFVAREAEAEDVKAIAAIWRAELARHRTWSYKLGRGEMVWQ